MSETMWNTLIQSIFGAIVTIALAWIAFRTEALKTQTNKQDKKLNALSDDLDVVHKATNSLVTQLVSAERQVGHAEGMVHEKARADSAGTKNPPSPPLSVAGAVVQALGTLTTAVKENPEETAKKVVERLDEKQSPGEPQ